MATVPSTDWIDQHVAYGLAHQAIRQQCRLIRVGFPEVLADIVVSYATVSPKLLAFANNVAPRSVTLREGVGPDAHVWTLTCEPSGMFHISIGLLIGDVAITTGKQYVSRQRLLLFLIGETSFDIVTNIAKKVTIDCLQGDRHSDMEPARAIVTRLLDMLRADIIAQFNERPKKKQSRLMNRPRHRPNITTPTNA